MEFVGELWGWLKVLDNATAVIAIAAVCGPIFAPIVQRLCSPIVRRKENPSPQEQPSPPPASAPRPPPGGEVRMSVADFEDARETQRQRIIAERDKAHGEDRKRLESQIAELNRQLSDVEAAYEEERAKIAELTTALDRLSGTVGEDRLAEARGALVAGDFAGADAVLAEIEAGEETVVARTAEAAFQRGEIAAQRIDWAAAADHFDKAARLDPTVPRLARAGEFARRAGRYEAARRHMEDCLGRARREHGEASLEVGEALNNLANLRKDMGQIAEAESLYLQALEICQETLGDQHPNYSAGLNNLAVLLRETGRYEEAEPLYRQVLEIDREALGERHPDYATGLNNLAVLLREIGRHAEAESLYRQALEIGRETLGEQHPDYATRLNNLGTLLAETEHHEEAEVLYRRALEIDRATLGEQHPDYAGRLNNLAELLRATGRHKDAEPLYRQALNVFRAALGDEHPHTRGVAHNYAALLRPHSPDSPALAELEAAFGEGIGRD